MPVANLNTRLLQVTSHTGPSPANPSLLATSALVHCFFLSQCSVCMFK